jgi:hypothetical protein
MLNMRALRLQGYELREDLRMLPSRDGKMREDDVMIMGKTNAWIGSHKTHVKGAKCVSSFVHVSSRSIVGVCETLAMLRGR